MEAQGCRQSAEKNKSGHFTGCGECIAGATRRQGGYPQGGVRISENKAVLQVDGDGRQRRRTGVAAREASDAYVAAGMYSGRILYNKDDACHGCIGEFRIMRASCVLRYDAGKQPVIPNIYVRALNRRMSP